MTPKKNALSKGIEIASGEIIISTDADCRVGRFWVSSMAYSVKNKDCFRGGVPKHRKQCLFGIGRIKTVNWKKKESPQSDPGQLIVEKSMISGMSKE